MQVPEIHGIGSEVKNINNHFIIAHMFLKTSCS